MKKIGFKTAYEIHEEIAELIDRLRTVEDYVRVNLQTGKQEHSSGFSIMEECAGFLDHAVKCLALADGQALACNAIEANALVQIAKQTIDEKKKDKAEKKDLCTDEQSVIYRGADVGFFRRNDVIFEAQVCRFLEQYFVENKHRWIGGMSAYSHADADTPEGRGFLDRVFDISDICLDLSESRKEQYFVVSGVKDSIRIEIQDIFIQEDRNNFHAVAEKRDRRTVMQLRHQLLFADRFQRYRPEWWLAEKANDWNSKKNNGKFSVSENGNHVGFHRDPARSPDEQIYEALEAYFRANGKFFPGGKVSVKDDTGAVESDVIKDLYFKFFSEEDLPENNKMSIVVEGERGLRVSRPVNQIVTSYTNQGFYGIIEAVESGTVLTFKNHTGLCEWTLLMR